MKTVVNVARYFSGSLLVFSGLVKAIDPLGLAYKMQEFFEAWAQSGFLPSVMEQLGHAALTFSFVIITLEVAVGVALILGWKPKITSSILLLLIVFFTFLTSYVLLSGKIKACGCFGDCIPLTPIQTFCKDLLLLVLAILLLWKHRQFTPLLKPLPMLSLLMMAIAFTPALQWYVLGHLPLKDCLPYRVGNNIVELRKIPVNAIPDQYDIRFVYQKNNTQQDFTTANLPDSSWEFVERKQTLIKAGQNNVPLISDFTLTTASGFDSTEAILNQKETYFLLFVKDLKGLPKDFRKDQAMLNNAFVKNIPFYIVTGQQAQANQRYGDKVIINGRSVPISIFSCDATAIKTAARAALTLYKMNGPVVMTKWGWKDFDAVGL
jgi:uncharacterized membrane protein YphA (DoxX/SURF4 family)